MSTTRAKIREQVQLAYGQFLRKNGFDDNIDKRLVDIYIEQAINKFVRPEVLQSIKSGNIEVPTCNIVAYSLPVSASIAEIPVFPITLPLDMGVWSVSTNGVYHVPITKGMHAIYKGTYAERVEGRSAYTVQGRKIIFLSSAPASIDVEVLVSDFTTVTESDVLPINPSIEIDVVNFVLETILQSRSAQAELSSLDNKRDAN